MHAALASGSGSAPVFTLHGVGKSYGTGEVEVQALHDVDLELYRHPHVGFVFQFYTLIPGLTALENVELVTVISTQPMARRPNWCLRWMDTR